MRHGTCFRRRLSTRHAGAAPHSAVAELGVVRRRYTLSLMNVPTDSSSPRLARHETIAIAITSTVAAVALGYGLFVGHPPAAFVLVFGLLGATFMALLLWGIVRNRYFLALFIAMFIYQMSCSFVPRIFYGRSHEVSWSVFSAQLGAFVLGVMPLFPAALRARRAAQQTKPK